MCFYAKLKLGLLLGPLSSRQVMCYQIALTNLIENFRICASFCSLFHYVLISFLQLFRIDHRWRWQLCDIRTSKILSKIFKLQSGHCCFFAVLKFLTFLRCKDGEGLSHPSNLVFWGGRCISNTFNPIIDYRIYKLIIGYTRHYNSYRKI